MKNFLLLILIFISLSFATIEIKTRSYDNKKVMYQMSYENGMMNGNFTSWHPNGKKKAGGMMLNNRRIGLWTLYDTLGNIVLQRNYNSPFQFELGTKANKNTLSTFQKFPLKRDSLGLYTYYPITEKEVLWGTRIWRELRKDSTNKQIFENNRLFNIIWKTIFETSEIEAYSPESDQLQLKLDIEKARHQWNNECEIVGYKIMEDYFFNSSLHMMETRILAICPIVENKISGENYDLCWVFYPQLRPYLAKEPLKFKAEKYLQNLDDLFYLRQFSSAIYKQENVNDRPISAYKQGIEIQKEAEFIEFSLMDAEHNMWLQQASSDKK